MDAKYIKCAAKCCGNKLLDRSDLTFFTFPEDDNLAKIWARYSNITSYQYGSTLCSEHFEDKYFDNTYGKKSVFKQNVQPIPTIFNKKIIKSDDSNTTNITENLAVAIKTEKDTTLTLDPPLQFNEYCRLCANLMPAKNLISLFNTSNNFKTLIDICLPGKVSISDNLPHAICKSCSEKLIECALILQKFKEADKKLRKIHPTPSTSKQQQKTDDVISISDDESQTKGDSDNLEDSETENVLEFLENVLEQTNKILEEIVPDDIIDQFETTDVTKNKSKKDSVKKVVEKLVEKDIIKFKCVMCPLVFTSKDKIMLHAFHDHPESRGNKLISNIIKTTVWMNENETLNLPPAKIYQCTVCNVKLNSQEAVIKHTNLNHKNIDSDRLLLVKVIDPQPGDIIKHMCVNCPKIFDSQREVQNHGHLMHPKSKIISKSIVLKKGKNNDSLVAPLAEDGSILNTLLINPPTNNTFHPLYRTDTISDTINLCQLFPHRVRRFEVKSEPLQSYHIKYQCKSCSDIFKTYKHVLDHHDEKHSELPEQSGPVALVVKVNDNPLEDIFDSSDKTSIIPIDDGTIIEADPNIAEMRPNTKSDPSKTITTTKYKCLKCPTLFETKKQIIQHNVSIHFSPDTKEIKCKVVTVTKKNSNYYRRNLHHRYECLICCSHHTTKFSLMQHMRLLHAEVYKHKFLYRYIESKDTRNIPKQCLRCSTLPLNYSRYRKHMRKHLSFPCEICDTNFTKIVELRNHLKKHKQTDKQPTDSNEPDTLKCIVCEQEFNSKSELLKHEKQHKVPKEVQCPNPKCNKRFNSDYELKKHEKRSHETCLCHECGKTYEKPYIRHHLQTHNKDCPFKCKMVNCKLEFKTQSSLFRHQRSHVRKNNNTICQVCGKIVSRSSLTLHMKIHSVVRNEVCDICGAAFYRKDHLRLHRVRHTQIENPRDNLAYKCPLCNISLQNKKAYMSHVSILHGIEQPELPKKKPQKNLSCVLCQKKFAFRCYLEDHYRQHRGERAHKCDVCKKSFATRIVLYQHKLTHLPYEQLRHQCDICNKKFRRHGQLVDHRRVHTGEKPFPCPICKRPFRVRGEMVKHMRIHTRKEDRIVRKKRPPPPVEVETTEDSENSNSSGEMVNTEKRPRVAHQVIAKNDTNFFTQDEDDISNLEDQYDSDMPTLE